MAGEKAVVGVIVSRVADLAGLLVVGGAAWAAAGGGGWEVAALPALCVVCAVVTLPVLPSLKVPVRPRGESGLCPSLARRVGRALEALREVSSVVLLQAFAFATPAWVLEAGILWAVDRGLGTGLSPAEILAATCLAVLVSAVPLAPGSLGTYEAGMVAALVSLGVPAGTAFVAAVVTHAVKFSYALAAVPFAFREGLAAVRKGGADEAGVGV